MKIFKQKSTGTMRSKFYNVIVYSSYKNSFKMASHNDHITHISLETMNNSEKRVSSVKLEIQKLRKRVRWSSQMWNFLLIYFGEENRRQQRISFYLQIKKSVKCTWITKRIYLSSTMWLKSEKVSGRERNNNNKHEKHKKYVGRAQKRKRNGFHFTANCV